VILSDVDGLLDNNKKVIPIVKDITPEIMTLSAGTSNIQVARGGMKTKIDAVKLAREAHIPCIIAEGNVQNVLMKIISGEPIGTYFTA
jgi:glutamate 5-kinase